MMNEDGVNDTQMTWIYEFNDDSIYGLHSHGLGRQELFPMYCDNPRICLRHKMIEREPDEEIEQQEICKFKVHLPAVMDITQSQQTSGKSGIVIVEVFHLKGNCAIQHLSPTSLVRFCLGDCCPLWAQYSFVLCKLNAHRLFPSN
jgi:hypothetical protein